MESNLINDNDNIKFEYKKENNIKGEINENIDTNIYNKEKNNREDEFEISKDISYKNNINNKILNPVNQKSRDKKKGQSINLMQKLIETKRNTQKNEDSTREKSNFKEDESSEISEKENTNKNESIDNENSIKNNINNKNLLAEKLKIIFQKRNKSENKNKFDDLKYSSDSNSDLNDNNLNNEEIKTETKNNILSDNDDDNNYNNKNNVKRTTDLNKNEDELISISSSEDENEIKKMEEEDQKKKEIEIRAQKLIQMMIKQKPKKEKEEEEEEKEEEENLNNDNNDNINEENNIHNSKLNETPNKIIHKETEEYDDDSEKDNSIKKTKYNKNLYNDSNISKNKFSNEEESEKSDSNNEEEEIINKKKISKKTAQINGLRNILEMLKEKQLEKEREEEKIRVEEARIRKEERENRIREREERRKKRIEEEKEKELLKKKEEEEKELLRKKEEEEKELLRKKEEEIKKREKEALEELEKIRKEKERKKKEEEEKELKEQEEIQLRENKRLEEEMKRKENQRKKFAEIQSQYEKLKQKEAKIKTEEKNKTSQKLSTSKISSSNMNNNNSNYSLFYNNKNMNNNNNSNINYPFTPKNIEKNNNKSFNTIESEFKRQISFSEYQTQEKELVLFEEIPKIQDRSFDSGITYQKPIQTYFTNQDIGTRSTKTLIYSRKGIKQNLNKNNPNINKIKNNRNNNKITNLNSPILNNSFQGYYHKKNQNIYSRSPERYSKPIKNIINNRYMMNDFEKLNNSSFNKNVNSVSYSNNKNYNNLNNLNNSNNQSSLSINLEDLMILEEKLSDIINAVIANKNLSNECFEWWNYYYNCSLFGKIEKVFKGNDTNIIKSSINYELLSIMICYDLSFDKNLLKKVFIMIKAILNLNHKNLIIICEYILSKISNDSLLNSWVYKLRDLVNSATSISDESEYVSFNIEPLSLIEKIKYNTNCISNDIKMILKNYPYTQLAENLVLLYKNILDSSYEDLNQFFREKILRVENPNASVLASVVLKENSNFYTVAPPYLKTKNLKKYTLVLDLDETIINFKINSSNESEGVLRVRPGIYEFLETVGKYYEIVVFTVATQEYADLIIDAIEENKIYFDYRLYRQHAVIIDNDFVKDLSRLGRPIDKIIIVDNMLQNFRLQKENGINIRTFWGEDPYDTALFDLMPILVNIAKEGGDVRFGLKKYRDEIVRKVTSNISKH